MLIDPEAAKLLAALDRAEEYRGPRDGERKCYECIVELYVRISEELEALIDGQQRP